MSDLEDLAAAARRQSGDTPRNRLPPFSTPPQEPQQLSTPYAHPQSPNIPMPAGVERCWHVHDRGNQLGPHTEVELATLVAVGTISTTAMVWRTGSPRWVAVSAIVPMPVYLPQQAAMDHPSQRSDSHSSNRIGVGLCAIFLGCLGIHKFMLGYTGPALVMLLVSVCGSIFVFPVGVMATIGFIEGIVYLTKTDAQFHREYVVGKRHWF